MRIFWASIWLTAQVCEAHASCRDSLEFETVDLTPPFFAKRTTEKHFLLVVFCRDVFESQLTDIKSMHTKSRKRFRGNWPGCAPPRFPGAWKKSIYFRTTPRCPSLQVGVQKLDVAHRSQCATRGFWSLSNALLTKFKWSLETQNACFRPVKEKTFSALQANELPRQIWTWTLGSTCDVAKISDVIFSITSMTSLTSHLSRAIAMRIYNKRSNGLLVSPKWTQKRKWWLMKQFMITIKGDNEKKI